MKASMNIKTMTCLLAGAALTLTACGRSKSSDLMAPPAPKAAPYVYSADKAVGDKLSIEFNPKVDILFVIDNSKSMLDEQTKLRSAIASFIEKLGGSSVLDYRLGVITVYDATHCSKLNNCYAAGKLRSPFVSRNDKAADQLKAALEVGVLEPKDGGPEFEQLFHPIAEAFSPAMNSANGGFIRPDSHVVIVMITDESDSSTQLSVDDFLAGIERTAHLSRVDMYAIVAKSSIGRNNFAQDRAPVRIKNAIVEADGKDTADNKIFAIEGDANFGSHLGNIVTDIKKRVMSQKLLLPSMPESKTIKLFYGTDEVKKGWAYNPPMPMPNGVMSLPKITINESVEVNYDPAKRFSAQYIKIEDFSVQKGKVTTVTY
jgi:hypothetical protein